MGASINGKNAEAAKELGAKAAEAAKGKGIETVVFDRGGFSYGANLKTLADSAREAGLETVAVYSEADRRAPHVRWADSAFCLGPAPSSASYLRGEALIALALEQGCQAIHPGYGFLSENADFAEAVEKAGLILIGPSSQSIRTMGNKVAAKQAVAGFEIPLVPGTDHPVSDPAEALAIAQQIGFPLLIKAAAGGGGKGMRIVHRVGRDLFVAIKVFAHMSHR
mgnify:CR=1 FL=1